MRFTPNMSRKSQCFDTSKCKRKFSKCQTPAACRMSNMAQARLFRHLANEHNFWNRSTFLKPGFYMSGKSQTIGDFTFFRPSQILPIYRIFARGLSQILRLYHSCHRDAMFICDRGTGAKQFRGLVMSEIHRRRIRTPTSPTIHI